MELVKHGLTHSNTGSIDNVTTLEKGEKSNL